MQATATTLENTQETAPVNSRNKVVVASLIAAGITHIQIDYHNEQNH